MSTWHESAACRAYAEGPWETNSHTKPSRLNQQAIAVCATCPVRQECLEEALRVEAELPASGRWHIYGGLMPNERAAIEKETAA